MFLKSIKTIYMIGTTNNPCGRADRHKQKNYKKFFCLLFPVKKLLNEGHQFRSG